MPATDFAAGFASSLADAITQKRQNDILKDERTRKHASDALGMLIQRPDVDPADLGPLFDLAYGEGQSKKKSSKGTSPTEMLQSVLSQVHPGAQGAAGSDRTTSADSAGAGPAMTAPGGSRGIPVGSPQSAIVSLSGQPQSQPVTPTQTPRTITVGGVTIPVMSPEQVDARDAARATTLLNRQVDALMANTPGLTRFQAVQIATKHNLPDTPTPTTPAGFTLGQGQQRFDASGQLVASGAPVAPKDPTVSAGSFEDYVGRYATAKGKPVSAVTTQEILQLRKEYMQADDRPLVSAAATAPVTLKPGSADYRQAQDLSDGTLTFSDFNKLHSSRAQGEIPVRSAIYDMARQLNPNFNPAQYEMGYKFASNPQTQRQVAAVKNVETGVPDLLKFSDRASRSGIPILNKALQLGGVNLGGKSYSNFGTAVTAFADELSGALGFGSATDMSREMGFDMTDLTQSPETFRSNVEDVLIPFVARKKASLLGQMSVYGQPAGGAPPPATPTSFSVDYKGKNYTFDSQGKLDLFKRQFGIP